MQMTVHTVVEDDFLSPTSSQFSCTCTCNGGDDNDCRVDDHCSAVWGHWCFTSAQKEMKVCVSVLFILIKLCCTMTASNVINHFKDFVFE